MKNKKTGFLYFSKLSTEYLSIFTQVNRLAAIQSENIVNIGINNDELSIDIYVEDREDLSEGSVLVTVSTEGISVDDSEIETIFNNILEGKDHIVKTLSSANIHICGVNLGATVNLSTLNSMFDVIRSTTTTYDVVNLLPIIGSTINTTNDIPETLQEASFPLPSKTRLPSEAINMEQLVLAAVSEVIKQITNDASEVQGLLLNIKKDKKEIINDIVNDIKAELTQMDLTKIEKPQKNSSTVNVITEVAPTISSFGVESEIITDPLEALKQTINTNSTSIDKPTDIYNNLIKLSDLVEGCESDVDLFKKVMENKDRLSLDDMENACIFNMYEKITNNDLIKLGNREAVTRKNRLGL
ncbi:MAG: hypothetical protein ACRCX2_20805 [Paraclostridium sp.]